MMNKDIKTDWLFLLRSGEIKQGKHKLNDTKKDSFCVFGLLCEMAVAHGVVEKYVSEHVSRYDGDSTGLPPSVIKWAGLHPPSPQVDGVRLAQLNDSGDSFAEIADLIEKHL